jgi:hypothetical protein
MLFGAAPAANAAPAVPPPAVVGLHHMGPAPAFRPPLPGRGGFGGHGFRGRGYGHGGFGRGYGHGGFGRGYGHGGFGRGGFWGHRGFWGHQGRW